MIWDGVQTRQSVSSGGLMLRLSIVCLAVFAALGAAQAGVIPDRLVKAVQDRVAAGTYPALVIGMVDGDKTEVRAFGTLDGGKAPDGDTLFEIGSITKTFTATILARAVLDKEVSLDDPVAKLLPDFTIPSRGGKQITLEEIATQHSGLPRMPNNFAPADPGNPYADYDVTRLRAFLAQYQLPRDPGASYEYSNLGFGLLGQALIAPAHTDYATLVQRKILEPLRMTGSGVVLSDAMRAHLASGHNDLGKPQDNWDLNALAGAGAIRSTAHDMLLYLRANMGVDKTALFPAMQLAHAPRADVSPGMRIGLAWMTLTTPKVAVVWHDGETGGYAASIAFTTDGQRGVVVLTNAAVEVNDLSRAALDPDAPLEPARRAIAMTPSALDAYAGTYKIAGSFVLVVSRVDDRLYARATGQDAFPLFASAPDEFFARIGGISISFTRDAKGAVAGLVLHQNGDHIAPKMTVPPAVTLDAATLSGYVGKYQLVPGAVLDITLVDGELRAQLTGQPVLPIFASAKDKFFCRMVDAQIDFERDAGGAIVALTLHQNGRDLRAPRLP